MQHEIEAIYGKQRNHEAINQDDQLRFVMSERSGRAFIHRVLSDSGVFHFEHNTDQALSFIEGRRVVGVMIMNDALRVCPDLFTKMIQEFNANE